MKKRFLLLLLSGTCLFSQVSDEFELNKVLPSSPETASMAKFINLPVNYHNGLPSIEIPLYTIQTKTGLNIPIKLSYHASGILVNEQATQVGLGWKLSTGGMISREVNGFPDELVGRRLPAQINNLDDYLSSFSLVDSIGDEFCETTATEKQLDDYTYVTDVTEIGKPKQFDILPDIFYYETPTGSGKFVYDSQWKIHTIPYDPISITKNPGDADFEIKDVQGNVFIYNIGSTYTQIPGVSQFNFFLEQAKLNTITTALNEVITYNYSSETYTYKNPLTEVDYTKIYSNGSCSEISDNTQPTSTRFVNKRLDQIDFNGGRIEFHYSDDSVYAIEGTTIRKDLPGASALRRVVVYNNQNNVIKDFELSYSYFESAGGLNSDPDNYRLKLDSVTEKGQNPYEFTYYGNGNIPHRFSTQQDHWGYYGGSGELLPSVRYLDFAIQGSDRSVDELLIKTGTLEKITYPTKGNTTFYYNENEYKSDQEEVIYTTNSSPIFGTIGEHSFILPDDSNNTRIVHFQNECGNASNEIQEDYCSFTIRNQSNEIVAQNNTEGSYILNSIPSDGIHFTVTLEGNFGQNCNCTIRIDGETETTQIVNKKTQLRGLRLDKMAFNPISGNIITTTYDYTKPGTANAISKTSIVPKFYYIKDKLHNEIAGSGTTSSQCKYLVRSSTPVSTQKSGYEFVKEMKIGNGYTNYTFHPSISGTINTPLYRPSTEPLLGGTLLSKETYSVDNRILEKEENSFLLDLSTNSFSNDHRSSFPNALTIGMSFNQIGNWTESCEGGSNTWYYIQHNIFNINSGWVKNNQTKTTNYIYNNSNDLSGSIETTTNYFYDNPTHAQVTRTETTSNNGEMILSKIFYPDDINSVNALGTDILTTVEYQDINKLKRVGKHQIATPIQIESYRKKVGNTAELLSIKRTLFKEENSFVLPDKIQSSKNLGLLEDRIEYKYYDTHGNILEIAKTNGTPISYIWGYNKQYPVAKIENATYAEIESILGVGFSLDANGLTEQQEITLRTSLPNAQVTTFKYKPLIGITSMTDPKGYTMYYEYDEFNRLKHVKDAQGNILSENEYHYAN